MTLETIQKEIVSHLHVFNAFDEKDKPLSLRRLGRNHDGGYVTPELAGKKADVLLSYGIGDDPSFEESFAGQFQKKTFGFDCTVGSVYITNPLTNFVRACIASINTDHSLNFESQLHLFDLFDKKIFIKMDIEGNEYDVFPEILKYASQITGIIIEIHGLHEEPTAQKALDLLKSFQEHFLLVHLHGNNHAPNFTVPSLVKGEISSVLELSFINTNLVSRAGISKKQKVPTFLDHANNAGKVDNEFELIITQDRTEQLAWAKSNRAIDLRQFPQKISSQSGEDGIIEAIFHMIETTNKYYVEFGGGIDYDNTRFLREKQGWSGTLFCGDNIPEINCKKEFVTPENINHLFQENNVPLEFDFLSIDIDSNDWYVWRALQFNPRVVCIEFNPHWLEDKVVVYDPHLQWDGSNYYGATLLAMHQLGLHKGYTLVAVHSVNAFFVRNNCLNGINFIESNNPESLLPHANPIHTPDTKNRPWTSAEILLRTGEK